MRWMVENVDGRSLIVHDGKAVRKGVSICNNDVAKNLISPVPLFRNSTKSFSTEMVELNHGSVMIDCLRNTQHTAKFQPCSLSLEAWYHAPTS